MKPSKPSRPVQADDHAPVLDDPLTTEEVRRQLGWDLVPSNKPAPDPDE
jgi:hypothetical protein